MEFQNGKIYTIRSYMCDKYYIGSTNHKTLAQRLGKHRGNYKEYLKDNNNYISSFEILQYTDHYIELLEIYPCNTKDELRRREGEIIRQYKSEIVNISIAGRTATQYSQENKQVILAKQKQYYINNKQLILETQKQTTICECGLTTTFHHKLRHMKSTKHINIINQQLLLNNELTFYNF